MTSVPVEEMTPVSERAREYEDGTGGVGADRDVVQHLPAISHGGYMERGHGSADRGVVPKLQVVPDEEVRRHEGSPRSTG